jgi:AcrR family transcriptional regulator
MVLVYHKAVTSLRQDLPAEMSGRVNQKRRTRSAIIAAAQAIVEQGVTPTVAQAAEDALVSRTTAYRYFPTQESLLLELSVNIDVRELEELAARPLAGSKPEDRLLEFVDLFNRHVVANEKLYRTGTRHYMDTWLAAERTGDTHPFTREGRRARMIATILEPLRGTIPDSELQRLQAALCLVAGGEAIEVLRDVCRLEHEEALAVTNWTADVILAAALPKRHRRTTGPSSPKTARRPR